jgi:hypothetical protein
LLNYTISAGRDCELLQGDACNLFANNGNLFRLKWMHFHEKGGCSPDAMDYTAMNGHLAIVKWLHVNRSEGCTKNAMDYAAMDGHLEIVKCP